MPIRRRIIDAIAVLADHVVHVPRWSLASHRVPPSVRGAFVGIPTLLRKGCDTLRHAHRFPFPSFLIATSAVLRIFALTSALLCFPTVRLSLRVALFGLSLRFTLRADTTFGANVTHERLVVFVRPHNYLRLLSAALNAADVIAPPILPRALLAASAMMLCWKFSVF
jgi:hypothetical protein